MPTGFYYNLDEQTSYEMEGATVPDDFPFVYFSDNVERVYLFQIPVYTFQARGELEGRDTTAYFAFNSFDRQMNFDKVSGLKKAKDAGDRFSLVMKGKKLLRAGFVYNGHMFFATKDAVYIIKQAEMEKNAMPLPVKVPLGHFLTCEPSAICE